VTLAPVLHTGLPPSDDDLVAAFAAGDERAFGEFYDRTVSRVHGLVRRVLVDPAQSEEVVQEVFLAVWQEASRFDPARGTALSWLMVQARRRAIDRVRSSQASRLRDLAVGVRDLDPVRDDVAESAAIRLEHARVTRALGGLSAVQRQALELTWWGGLTQAEAASRAGVPLGTMKTRLRDGLIALRRIVGAEFA